MKLILLGISSAKVTNFGLPEIGDVVPVPTVPKQTNVRIDIVCKSKISPYKNDIWKS
jgi:hypothetical protein